MDGLMRPGGEAGFTLIELVVVTVLIGILAMAATPPLINGLVARAQVQSDLDAMSRLRYATERIAREIRQVEYSSVTAPLGYQFTLTNPSITASTNSYTGITNVQSSTGLTFTRWGPACTTSCTTSCTVAINFVSPNVTYTNTCGTSGTTTMANNVSSLKFDYLGLDSSTGAATAPTLAGDATFYQDVRFVDITLTLTQDGAALSHRTRVQLRNGS